MSVPGVVSTDALDELMSVGFRTDADPATGSIATDSAITKDMIVRVTRIFLSRNAKR